MDHIPTTQTAVYRLRREAKKRVSPSKQSLAACLDAVAKEAGYHHWKHVTACAGRDVRTAPKPTVQHAATLPGMDPSFADKLEFAAYVELDASVERGKDDAAGVFNEHLVLVQGTYSGQTGVVFQYSFVTSYVGNPHWEKLSSTFGQAALGLRATCTGLVLHSWIRPDGSPAAAVLSEGSKRHVMALFMTDGTSWWSRIVSPDPAFSTAWSLGALRAHGDDMNDTLSTLRECTNSQDVTRPSEADTKQILTALAAIRFSALIQLDPD